MSLSFAFIIFGSIGMIIFATKFPCSTFNEELKFTDEKFIGLNGRQVWICSWILIIAGAVMQLLLYWVSLSNP